MSNCVGRAWALGWLLLGVSACASDGKTGPAGQAGTRCTVEEQAEGAVLITCDDGTSATVKPPVPDAGDAACSVTREDGTVTISCPSGSSVSFPVAESCKVSQAQDGAVTISCPDGSSVSLPGSGNADDAGVAHQMLIVGPTRSACGACHDSAPARAHFTAMTVEIDGQLQETCGTCHNETSIEPVTRSHARPELEKGLTLTINDVTIDAGTRKATANLTILDANNQPVDPAKISANFVIAKVPAVQPAASIGGQAVAPIAGPYQSYLTRVATQVDTPSFPLNGAAPRTEIQPAAEAQRSGTFTAKGNGSYDYTFGYTLPQGYDANETHMVAIYATMSVDGVRYVANAEKFFVPADPSATPLKRDSVLDTACNSCHNPLAAHGGSRQDLQLCLGCHTQGAKDPESENSIDFNVMVHRIHSGRNLPSVKAGKPYIIIGNAASVHDFSDVGFPNQLANCQSCHNNSADDRWVTNGVASACTSCHDDIYEPGKHIGTLAENTTCGNSNCHAPGGLAPDAREAHLTLLNNPAAQLFNLEILSVTLDSADEAPVVRIRARTGTLDTGAVNPVASVNNFQLLNVFLNGPNTGFLANGGNIKQIAKADLVDFVADGATPGEFTFKLPSTLRELVAGLGNPDVDSYTLSLRGNYDPTPGAMPDNDRVDMLKNPTFAFTAGEELKARAAIVDTNKCNNCHGDLRFHGGGTLARSTEQCAMCHTATFDTRGRQGVSKIAGPTTSLRFSTLIHRVHGNSLAEQPYVVYGYSATAPHPQVDFSEVLYPGDLRDCTTCHVGNSYTLPLPLGTPPTQTAVLDANGAVISR